MTTIDAINNVAKAYEDLAKVLIAVAEKTKGIPVNQVMDVDADEAPKKKETEADEKPAKEEAAQKEKSVTLEQVRAVLAEKSQAGLTPKVKELLDKFGAKKLSEVQPKDYEALMLAAAELKEV